jgi:hypothetical protein
MKINHRWQIVATIPYTGAVSSDENPVAHGGICDIEVRRAENGDAWARRVNRNNRQAEIGPRFRPSPTELAAWLGAVHE